MTDIAITGAGHNGLIAACYLAQAGHNVSVYEQSDRVGGLCVNEELFAGVSVGTWANWAGMIQPQILDDLSVEPPEFISETVVALTYEGACMIGEEYLIPGLSEKDKLGAQQLDADILALAENLKELFLHPAPSRELYLEKTSHLSLHCGLEVEEFLSRSALDVVVLYISDDGLRSLMAAQTFVHPGLPGTAFEMVYMRTPCVGAKATGWGTYRGGMGALTQALAKKAQELGVEIHLNYPVTGMVTNKNRSIDLETQFGQINADLYLFATDFPTFEKIRYGSWSDDLRHGHAYGNANLHLLLKNYPVFSQLEDRGRELTSSMTLTPAWESFRKSLDDVRYGRWLDQNVLSIGFPCMVDPQRSDRVHKLMCIHPDYAPLSGRGADKEWTDEDSREYAHSLIREIEHYAPDFSDLIVDWELVTSREMRSEYGVTGAHCFHGDMVWPHVLDARMSGYGAGPETDLENVFLCGSSCAPGGTVTGAPGYRCAQHIINKISL